MIDIAVAYPCDGNIKFQSRFLFSDPESETCQLFLQRLSSVEQVQQVTVTKTRQTADIFYRPDVSSRRETIDAIRRCLIFNGGHKKNSKNGTNGHASNG